MLNGEGGRRALRVALFLILHSIFNIQHSSAAELSVDKSTITMDDRVTVRLALDGPFSDLEDIAIPLQNLVFEGQPSSQVEFRWVNGTATYRRTLVYVARGKGPGAALVGPLMLRGKNGATQTLAPVAIQVLPDVTGGSGDPLTMARELLATQRDPIFVVATADKHEAFVGEAIVVTWTLYNATALQRFSVNDTPRLDDFWVEEIPLRDPEPEIVMVGDLRMQRVPIRRSVVYPLRSGMLAIGSMSINAEAVRRIGMDRFGIPYEGMLVDINRRSPLLAVNARPLPPGSPVNAVGEVELTCSKLPASVSGPIALNASLTGHANLRSAEAPSFERAVEGTVQIVEAGFSVDRRKDDAVMMRRWRYVIFPERSGRLTIPPLTTTILTPVGERRMLRCAEQTLTALGGGPAPATGLATKPASSPRVEHVWPWICGMLLVTISIIAMPPLRRARALRASVRAIVRATPAETRGALHAWLGARGLDAGAMLAQASDRGDAIRGIISFLDATERDRIPFDLAEARRRAMDVVETCAVATRMAQSR